MAQAFYRNKAGGVQTFNIPPGTLIREFLRCKGIPVNGVLTTVNGRIVCEDTTVVTTDDRIEFEQVRHYDLSVTRQPPLRTFGVNSAPIYAKSVVFDHGGDIEVRSEHFDENSYVSYVETTFVESVRSRGVLFEGMQAAIGLSGGRDSVAFLKLLERTAEQLPKCQLTAVTITGLPDWEEAGTFGAARKACSSLGIEHVIVGADAIADTFKLDRPFVEVMTDVVAGENHQMVMVATHHVMRRMIEVQAQKRRVNHVLLGLNADDLVATLVTWMTSGFQMGPIPARQVGPFMYAFPLYRITKKELTLYLRLTAPELTRQGTPGRFTTGPGERSLSYAITDHLFDLWGGIDYYMFDAFSRMATYQLPRSETACSVCGATYTLQQVSDHADGSCDICALFARYNHA